jgi:hypothetical protein
LVQKRNGTEEIRYKREFQHKKKFGTKENSSTRRISVQKRIPAQKEFRYKKSGGEYVLSVDTSIDADGVGERSSGGGPLAHVGF